MSTIETVRTTTPFGSRPITAHLLASQRFTDAPIAVAEIDKWQLFNELRTARTAFGLTDRDLSVLNALLSFVPSRALSDDPKSLIVFPSNAALSARAHGMADSTLRRHLTALVNAGIIMRHDSPNGKRYAHRDRSGEVINAFGLSLRPMLARSSEIAAAAETITALEVARRMRREDLVLRLRDATKLLAYALDEGLIRPTDALFTELSAVRLALRRKLSTNDLDSLLGTSDRILKAVQKVLSARTETIIMDANDVQSERHYQNSKPEPYESEPCPEKGRAGGDVAPEPETARLPLALVVKACPDIETFSQTEVRSWSQLVAASAAVRGMMGVSADAWHEAVRIMGPEVAAVTLAAILQKGSSVSSPGAYLRALTQKAAHRTFTPGPMIMALLSPANTKAV